MFKKCVLGGLALALALPLGSCRVEQEQIGICTGDEDGETYKLFFVNFMESLAEVYVDGRRVGQVANYNANAHAPGFQNFGSFPQCDDGTYAFSGSLNIYYEAIEWTPEAMAKWPDGCALEIWLLDENFDRFVPDDWFDFGQKVPLAYAEQADVPRCPNPNCYLRLDGLLTDCQAEYYDDSLTPPPGILNPELKPAPDAYTLVPHPQLDGVLLMTLHTDKTQSVPSDALRVQPQAEHQPLDVPPGAQLP